MSVLGLIDPFGGTDLKPGDPAPTPNHHYKSIDGFYRFYRSIDQKIILKAELLTGKDQMKESIYRDLQVDGGMVIIRGRINETIQLIRVSFKSGLTVILPEEYEPTDLPVIRTIDDFVFEDGYRLIVLDENLDRTSPNAERVIFEHLGNVTIDDSNGSMKLNRNGIIHRTGSAFFSTLPEELEVPTNCNFCVVGPMTHICNLIGNGEMTVQLFQSNKATDRPSSLIVGKASATIEKMTIDGQIKEYVIFDSSDQVEVNGGIFEFLGEGNIYLTNSKESVIGGIKTLTQEKESGSIFRKPHLINKDYVHSQFDGNIFMVDASNGKIAIEIPSSVVSDERLFRYKRIDRSIHSIIIKAEGGIEGKKAIRLNGNSSKRTLPYLELYGCEGKVCNFQRIKKMRDDRTERSIKEDYTHSQFDGNIFMVDASGGAIEIKIPGGDISKNRLLRYKRIDDSCNKVLILADDTIEGKPGIYLKSSLELYGYSGRVYVFGH